MIGDGKAFKRGRDVFAALDIVPRQYSTVLLGISKRGDKYLRMEDWLVLSGMLK